ncbi:MAG: hypothetical protein U0M60_05450 [Clostridia bacterium]|nr:hypothetical protein [Clostridia bacterium]
MNKMLIKRTTACAAAITVMLGVSVPQFNYTDNAQNFVYAEESSKASLEYDIEAKTDMTGNIFIGKNFGFKLDISNQTSAAQTSTLDYSIYDERGAKVKDGTVTATLNVGENAIAVSDSVDKYGVYTIDFTLKDTSGTTVAAAKSEFSAIVATEQNPKLGFSQGQLCHGMGTADDVAYLSKILGMGIIRDDYPATFIYDASDVKEDGSLTLWSESTKASPSAAWKRIPAFDDAMNKNNIETLAILTPGGSWPTETGEVNSEGELALWPWSTETLDDTNALKYWYDYCYYLALWQKGKCETFEICNEWSIEERNAIKEGTRLTMSSAEAYARILKVSSQAIRAANPNAKIIAFCAEKQTDDDYDEDAQQYNAWIRRAITALGDNPGQYFDAISVHPYRYWKSYIPEQAWDPNDYLYTNKAALRSFVNMLKEFGLEDKPLYSTEYGESVTRGRHGWNDLWTEHDKARLTIRDTVVNGEFFDKQYVYTLYLKDEKYPQASIDEVKNSTELTEAEKYSKLKTMMNEQNFGVLRTYTDTVEIGGKWVWDSELQQGVWQQGTIYDLLEEGQVTQAALPAAIALAAYNKIMNNAEYVSDGIIRSSSANTLYDYQYSTSDGEVCVIWDVGEDITRKWNTSEVNNIDVNLHIDEKKITVYDMYGNETVMESPYGNYTVTIGSDPIYIKAASMDGLRRISGTIEEENDKAFKLPYSASDWRLIFKDKNPRIGTAYKDGDGFGTAECEGKPFLFEMWN